MAPRATKPQALGDAVTGRIDFFVVTPFGNQTGDPEERATYDLVEGVRANIIQRAVHQCRLQGFAVSAEDGRADATGDHIWEKIAKRISTAAGVIGVIATTKPNTYIELGLAFGMWRRPILLRLSEQPMPTDLEGLERGDFTRAQALGQEDATAVVEWLARRMLQSPSRSGLVTPSYLPLTTAAEGQIRTYNRFSRAISFPEWSNTLWRAENEIILAGPKLGKILNNKWFSRPDRDMPDTHLGASQTQMPLFDLLGERVLVDGVDVTILLPDMDRVDETDLKRPLQFEALEQHLEALSRSRRSWFTFRRSVDEGRRERNLSERQTGKVHVVTMTSTRFPYRLTMTDKRMFLTMRFHSESVNTGFTIDATPSSQVSQEEPSLFHVVRREIDLIIQESQKGSEAAYQSWLAGNA